MASEDVAYHAPPSEPQGDAVLDKSKYQSPPPPPSSMTPPPSNQVPHVSTIRTPTPPNSHLSSPPPTIKAAPHSNMLDLGHVSISTEQVATASTEELRSMVHELVVACRDAKTSAAHHKLQYQLLCMERDESMNRMSVELDILQREVEFLQSNPRRSAIADASPAPPSQSVDSTAGKDETNIELHSRIRALEADIEILHSRLTKAKTMIIGLGNDVVAKIEDNDRLRKRIRENRLHFNMLRRSSEAGEPSPFSVFSTPADSRLQHYGSHDDRVTSTPKATHDTPFAQLLLADQMLSQEATTSPSTPTGRGLRKATSGHVRGSHSLSSLPSTPQDHRSLIAPKGYQFPHASSRMAMSPIHNATPSHTRRFSRDSTISASDMEDREELSDDEIPESQASQEAVSMLLKSATRNAESASANSSQTRSGGLVQSKIHGSVKKTVSMAPEGGFKRKMIDDEAHLYDSSNKRSRMSEGVGLGIH